MMAHTSTNTRSVSSLRGSQESCCGLMAFEIGFRGEFTKFAESNIDDWNAAGVKKVVTGCACCYGTFKRLYPLVGKEMKFDVMHITEFIDQLIQEGKLEFSREAPMRVTYHDPCNLGRKSESYEQWNGKEEKVLGQFILRDPPKVVKRGWEGIYEPPRNIINNIPGVEYLKIKPVFMDYIAKNWFYSSSSSGT